MGATLRLGLTAALALAAGCVSVQAHKAPGVSLAGYHTFAFLPARPNELTQNQATFDRSPAGQAAREAVGRNLQEKGYVPTTPDRADFLVTVRATLQQQVDWGYGPDWVGGWYGWYGWYGWPAASWYTVGTVIVDFMDPRTRQVIWRGTASRVVNHPNNPDPTHVAGAVDKLMNKNLPPQTSSLAAVPRPRM
jgi:hypothetical protein